MDTPLPTHDILRSIFRAGALSSKDSMSHKKRCVAHVESSEITCGGGLSRYDTNSDIDVVLNYTSICVFMFFYFYQCKLGHINYVCKKCGTMYAEWDRHIRHMYSRCYADTLDIHFMGTMPYILMSGCDVRDLYNSLEPRKKHHNLAGCIILPVDLFDNLPQTVFIDLRSYLFSQIILNDVDISSFGTMSDNYGKTRYVPIGYSSASQFYKILDKFVDIMAKCRFCGTYYDCFPTFEVTAGHMNICEGWTQLKIIL